MDDLQAPKVGSVNNIMESIQRAVHYRHGGHQLLAFCWCKQTHDCMQQASRCAQNKHIQVLQPLGMMLGIMSLTHGLHSHWAFSTLCS
jgi:hypothetical protein